MKKVFHGMSPGVPHFSREILLKKPREKWEFKVAI
jgi:hypothetical protein